MKATVDRMSGLIDNVLDFARGRLGGGITLDRNPMRCSNRYCIRSSMNSA